MSVHPRATSAAALLGILLFSLPYAASAAPREATDLPGVTASLAVQPSFDPLSASSEDLAANGFPPRPDKKTAPHAFESWRRAVTSGARRVFPNLVRTAKKHRPMLPRGASNGTAYSSNWSGYVLLDSTTVYGASSFYYVMGDYVVPTAKQAFGACTGGWDYAAAWVGIDGYNSADVLQAGADMDAYCASGATASYYTAWYEWYPDGEVAIGGFPISAGDDLFVEIWNTSAVSGGTYIVDYTTNQAISLGFGAPAGTSLLGNSAEWIVERPSLANSLATLSNYSQDFFEEDYAGDFSSRTSVPGSAVAGVTIVPVVMLDNSGSQISIPGLLGPIGMWFYDANSARDAGSP